MKNTMKRKLLAALLTVCMVSTMTPAVFATEAASENEADAQANNIAMIGSEGYESVQAAINQAESGETITLTKDTSIDSLSVDSADNLTLNLNTHTLTLTGSVEVADQAYKKKTSVGSIVNKGSLKIENGAITSAAPACLIINQGNLTLSDNLSLTKSGAGNAVDNLGGTVDSSADIQLTNDNSTAFVTYGGVVTINGGAISSAGNGLNVFNRAYNNESDGAEVTINKGSITADIFAVSTNNLYSGGNKPSNVTINSGSFVSNKATAIYWPSAGTLTVGKINANNSDVSITTKAGSAIEICSGTLVVNSGTLQGSDSSNALNDSKTWAQQYRQRNDGCAGLGDALSISARRGTGYATAPLNVTLNGGSFTSSNNYAVRYFDSNQVESAEQIQQNVSVAIKGGTFTENGDATSAIDASVVDKADQHFISGGTFSSDVSGYVVTGYTCSSNNGGYIVTESEDGAMTITPNENETGGVSATLDGIYQGDKTAISSGNDEADAPSGNAANSSVAINLTTTTGTSDNKATLNVTKNAAQSLGKAESLAIKTNVGDVQLDSAALDKVAKTIDDVTITITRDTTSTSNAVKAAYIVEVKSGDTNLLPEGQSDGTVTITVDKPDGVQDLQAWYVVDGANGSLIYVDQLATSVRDSQVAITINHLSKIVLTDGTPTIGQAVASITKNGAVTYYATIDAAVDAATTGDIIQLRQNTSTAAQLNPTDGVTIDGKGYALTFDNGSSTAENPANQAFLNITHNNVTIKNLTINAMTIKHGVQFYCTEGGSLDNVTVNGGAYTSVQVNGSTGVKIVDTKLNPNTGAYANVEYSMGEYVEQIPSMSLDNVSFGNNATNTVYADWSTTNRIEEKLGGDQSEQAILDKIQDSITYTHSNGGNLNMTVLFGESKDNNHSVTLSLESTYQPPYTGDYNYPVTIGKTENGTVTIAKEDQWANGGEKITVTVTPDDAYMLDELIVKHGDKELEVTDNGDGTYTFTMPEGAVTITATFVEDPDWEEPEEPGITTVADIFSDVVPGAWYTDAVQYAYDNGLMTGTSATTFEPNTTTTRGMIVSMLHRLEGSPAVGSADFSDVASGDWYADPVAWAASEGIVGGYGDGTFGPNDPITREQMASILYRYADYKGLDVSARASLDAYSDADSVSPWASDVMSWAVSEGIISGMTEDTLAPQGTATRAQVAAMFQRFLENVMA